MMTVDTTEPDLTTAECPRCEGAGSFFLTPNSAEWVKEKTCPQCEGEGRVPVGGRPALRRQLDEAEERGRVAGLEQAAGELDARIARLDHGIDALDDADLGEAPAEFRTSRNTLAAAVASVRALATKPAGEEKR